MALSHSQNLSYHIRTDPFVLFINDLPQGISEDTHLALYADHTKIWRSIRNEEDTVQLQKDINNLHMWSINNKMMFHPDKCKVVTIKHKPSPLAILQKQGNLIMW